MVESWFGFFSFLYLLLMIVLMLYARSVIHNVYICSLAVIGSAWQLTLPAYKIILLPGITSSPYMKLNLPWKFSSKEKSMSQIVFLLLSLKHKYVLVLDTWRSVTATENSHGTWRYLRSEILSEITRFQPLQQGLYNVLRTMLCDDLDGRNGMVGGMLEREGIYAFYGWLMLLYGRNQYNTVKQLFSSWKFS